jgi:hypothetical protein
MTVWLRGVRRSDWRRDESAIETVALQQALNFSGAQNHRELLLIPGQGDAVNADGTVQRVGV